MYQRPSESPGPFCFCGNAASKALQPHILHSPFAFRASKHGCASNHPFFTTISVEAGASVFRDLSRSLYARLSEHAAGPSAFCSGDVVSASKRSVSRSGTYARKRRTTFRSRHVAWRADRPPSYRDGPDFARDSYFSVAREAEQVFPASEVAAAAGVVDSLQLYRKAGLPH